MCNRFNGYLKTKAGKGTDELFYDLEEPLILFEKLILDENGNLPHDFKVNIIKTDSEPHVFVQVDESRFTEHRRSFFDLNGKRLNFIWDKSLSHVSDQFSLPENYYDMYLTAEKLAKPFSYVRVDLYSVASKIYFGELTFTQGSGFLAFTDKKVDFELGGLWDEY